LAWAECFPAHAAERQADLIKRAAPHNPAISRATSSATLILNRNATPLTPAQIETGRVFPAQRFLNRFVGKFDEVGPLGTGAWPYWC